MVIYGLIFGAKFALAACGPTFCCPFTGEFLMTAMPDINPNPYKDGDPLAPTGRVTAIFDSFFDFRSATPQLEAIGFKGERCFFCSRH